MMSGEGKRKTFTFLNFVVVTVVLITFVMGVYFSIHLLRQTRLRHTVIEKQELTGLIGVFYYQHDFLPGDMPNAKDIWPDSTNGNGDGIISSATTGEDEDIWSWQQLSLAGIVPKSYTGKLANGGLKHGVNVPGSETGEGFWLRSYKPRGKDISANMLLLGAIPKDKPRRADGPVLSATEAQSVDIKFDDGQAGLGKVQADKGWEAKGLCLNDGGQYTSSSSVSCILKFPIE